jgi:nucleoid-associated protein YgaU
MGLWNFVKTTGKSLFDAEAAEAPDANADALKQEIDGLGLDATGRNIKINGDTVTVSGDAVSQDIKKKVILTVGNVKGVAAVQDEVPGVDRVFHTLAKGAARWAISSKTLGSGARCTEIFEANKPMLSHRDKIYPGQVLRIQQA